MGGDKEEGDCTTFKCRMIIGPIWEKGPGELLQEWAWRARMLQS